MGEFIKMCRKKGWLLNLQGLQIGELNHLTPEQMQELWGWSNFKDSIKKVGQEINKHRPMAEAVVSMVSPEAAQVTFGALDKINDVGDSFGGWDAIPSLENLQMTNYGDLTPQQLLI
jgi:hypothetical protein